MINKFFLLVCLLSALASCTPNLEPDPMTPIPMTSIPSSPSPATEWWHPAPGLTWQWQLDEEVDPSVEAQVYDIDLYADQSVIDALHARGVKVICYISVGSQENWRPTRTSSRWKCWARTMTAGRARSGWTSAESTCLPRSCAPVSTYAPPK